MIRLITSFLSNKDILKASKSKVPVIFLGGDCTDNSWRKDLEKEFGKDLYLIDPFDKNYDPATNTYKEVAGMLNSDYIIFYKGGKQSAREKAFLELIGRRDNLIKEFDNMDSLRKFLNKTKSTTRESIGLKIRKYVELLSKEALPYFLTPNSTENINSIDLNFEKLDNESITKVVKDILNGETVKIPKFDNNVSSFSTFNIKDLDEGHREQELKALRLFSNIEAVNRIYSRRNPDSIVFSYDSGSHSYIRRKFAKKNMKYEFSCTKVNLPEGISKSIMKWGEDNIKSKALYTEGGGSKGREDDIHVTVLYGIVDSDPAETARVISKIKPFKVRLGLINVFKDKKEYDVLKIEVESGVLERLHYDLAKKIDNENSFPTYKPHVTISYVKKGAGDKFVGDETFKGKTFTVDSIAFSNGDSEEKKLPLDI